MRNQLLSLCTVVAFGVALQSGAALAAPAVGQPAPDFTAVDSNGKTIHLSDFKGKEVVLEWTNDQCPYVRKWYGTGAMQKLQKDAAGEGAVWLTVISSGPGKEGYVTPEQANDDTKMREAAPSYVLMDSAGTIGHLYNAMTTPDMYVVDKDGILRYSGGADSLGTTDPADIQKAEPYAREAIDAVAKGQKVSNPVTRPYGCNVKYGS